MFDNYRNYPDQESVMIMSLFYSNKIQDRKVAFIIDYQIDEIVKLTNAGIE